jgi:hypothetical protein
MVFTFVQRFPGMFPGSQCFPTLIIYAGNLEKTPRVPLGKPTAGGWTPRLGRMLPSFGSGSRGGFATSVPAGRQSFLEEIAENRAEVIVTYSG